MSSELQSFPPTSGPLSVLTRSVAMLRHDPEQLKRFAGVAFRAGHDDLDALKWAEVVGLSGKRYALVRHLHSPQSGTEIVTSATSLDPSADIRDVLKALALTEKDLVWTASDVSNVTDKARAATVRRSASRRLVALRKPEYAEMRLRLTATDLTRLRRRVRGQGSFQILFRKLQKQLEGSELQVYPEDVERLLRDWTTYVSGGFQERTHAVLRTAKKAAKKR